MQWVAYSDMATINIWFDVSMQAKHYDITPPPPKEKRFLFYSFQNLTLVSK